MRLPFALVLVAGACTGDVTATQGPDAGADVGSGSDLGSGSGSGSGSGTNAPTISVMRGVDRASAFSATEAATLANSHGVKWTGVYIGGPCNAGSGWTKTLVASFATKHHWLFMPIYVGQQSSAICGAHTLTAGQGTADGQAAVTRMQAFGWQPNRDIPVCLDLEAGAYSSNPSAATAYARAWKNAVQQAGYLAYIYSNPTGINGMFDDGVKFDGAWPASWFFSSFHASAPEDLNQLGTRYTHQNRAWQYAGSFAVSGAGSVDGDTSDLLLAPEPGGTNK